MRWRASIVWLAAALSVGCANLSATELSVPALDVADARKPPGALTARLWRPAGPGPFPVVILLHGCGGISRNMTRWVERLNQWGYAAVALDSFSPRGVTTVCPRSQQPLVTPRDRAADVISMAVYLRTVSDIDGSRIGVLGFSHGGATAAWITQRRYEASYPHLLRAAVDYYGPCRSPDTQGSVPLLALAGEADDWGNPALSCRTYAAHLRPDQVFEVHTYPGAVHAFDNEHQGLARVEGHLLGYNHEAA